MLFNKTLMNSVTTIPKNITKGEELVIISRKEYNEFQELKRVREFEPTAAQILNLKRAREDYKKGKFLTLNEFKRKLASSRSR